MLQELIEAEATARIGAEWNEHTETRTAFRNGHRDKTLTSCPPVRRRSSSTLAGRSGASPRSAHLLSTPTASPWNR
ncbi:transposase [Kitasatospora sp. GP82]|uniref:transposase n=1 Tax=Kitasatospora sp. GP82 TaxID=3035089 RepID=UPI002473AF08|nr:transposase [Kitasatospora sp. GP82]